MFKIGGVYKVQNRAIGMIYHYHFESVAQGDKKWRGVQSPFQRGVPTPPLSTCGQGPFQAQTPYFSQSQRFKNHVAETIFWCQHRYNRGSPSLQFSSQSWQQGSFCHLHSCNYLCFGLIVFHPALAAILVTIGTNPIFLAAKFGVFFAFFSIMVIFLSHKQIMTFFGF